MRRAFGWIYATLLVFAVFPIAAECFDNSGWDSGEQANYTGNKTITGDFHYTGSMQGDGRAVFSGNAGASLPSVHANGSIYTGGTGETTTPKFLISSPGATSSAWSTSGTHLGINAMTGFAGNIFDFQVNGSSKIYGTAAGQLNSVGLSAGSGTISNAASHTSSYAGPGVNGAFYSVAALTNAANTVFGYNGKPANHSAGTDINVFRVAPDMSNTHTGGGLNGLELAALHVNASAMDNSGIHSDDLSNWDYIINTPSYTVSAAGNTDSAGYYSAKLPVSASASTPVVLTAVQCAADVHVNGSNQAIDYTLPAAAAGLNCCFSTGAFAQIVTVDADGTDTIVLNGVALTAGNAVDSAATAYTEYLCLDSPLTGYWVTRTEQGTWVDGGAD